MTTAVTPEPPPFFSPYLDDQCKKINSKPVPWEVSQFSLPCNPAHGLSCRGTNVLDSSQQMSCPSSNR